MIISGALSFIRDPACLPALSDQAVPRVLRPLVCGSQARGILGGPFEEGSGLEAAHLNKTASI